MHSAGTTIGTSCPLTTVATALPQCDLIPAVLIIEGSWEECMTIIGQCHSLVHDNGVARVHTDIRIGTRTDKQQGFADKVAAVEKLLAADGK